MRTLIVSIVVTLTGCSFFESWPTEFRDLDARVDHDGGLTDADVDSGMVTNPDSGIDGGPDGGSPVCVVTATGSAALIDDFEDADPNIAIADGRSGTWFAFHVDPAAITPAGNVTPITPLAGNDSTGAMHVAVSGVGGSAIAGVTVDLSRDLGSPTRCVYDASAYRGLRMRVAGSGQIDVDVAMDAVVPTTDGSGGGLCESDCYNFHGRSVILTPTWRTIEIHFDQLMQLRAAGGVTFDPRHLLYLQFNFPEGDSELWVDDLEFISATDDDSCRPLAAWGTAPLIDDFEDLTTTEISRLEGREGFWYPFGDGTGTFSPLDDTTTPLDERVEHVAPSPGNASAGALHLTGTGFTDYGWAVAANLNQGLGISPAVCTFDASIYPGVQFRIRGAGTSRVQLQTPLTTDSGGGGTCTVRCSDHFGFAVPLTTTWQTVQVTWDMLTQQGFGDAVTFDPSELLIIQFAQPSGDNEIEVDDVSFITP